MESQGLLEIVDLNIFLHILRQTNGRSKYNSIDGKTFLAMRAVCRKFRDFSNSIEFWRHVYQPLLVRLNMENTQITTNSGTLNDGTYIEGFMYFFHIYNNIINTPHIHDNYQYYNTDCDVILTSNGTLKVIYNNVLNFKTPYQTEVVTFSVAPPILLYLTADGELWEKMLLPRSDSDSPELTELLDKFGDFTESTPIQIPDKKIVLGILTTNNMSLAIVMLQNNTVSLFAWFLYECPVLFIFKRTPAVRIGDIMTEGIKKFNITVNNGEIFVNDNLLVDEETLQRSVFAYVYSHTYTQEMLNTLRNGGQDL